MLAALINARAISAPRGERDLGRVRGAFSLFFRNGNARERSACISDGESATIALSSGDFGAEPVRNTLRRGCSYRIVAAVSLTERRR